MTGATGFLGSHCLAPLVERGFDVLALYRERAPLDVAGVRWVRGDVMDRAAMRALLDEHKPKGLLHLAWFVEPGKLITDSSNLSWVSASLDLIRAFREAGGERCTISGSCYEYDWRFGYCVEDVTPCEPDTLYGAAKDSLRRTFLPYCNVSGLSGSWGRAFFIYGPRENPARLVSSVIISLLKGLPAKSSHGLQVRDYLHIQDVADGMVALFASQSQGAYNICRRHRHDDPRDRRALGQDDRPQRPAADRRAARARQRCAAGPWRRPPRTRMTSAGSRSLRSKRDCRPRSIGGERS